MKDFDKISKKTLKRYCDIMWMKICKYGHTKCEWCGRVIEKGKENKLLNTHHLITRQNLKFRHDINNHINVCSWCHKFGPKSIHTSPWFFDEWFKINKPERYKWFEENKHDFDNTAEDINLEKIYFDLENKYKELYGKPFRNFNKIFTKEEELEIIEDYLFKNISTIDLSKKYNCSKTPFSFLFKRYKVNKKLPVKTKEDIIKRLKISIANGGNRNGMFGKKHTNTKKCRSSKTFDSKKILQYDLNNQLIKEWDSIGDASKALKINRAGISLCCSNKLATSGGFIWKYSTYENMKTMINNLTSEEILKNEQK